MKINYLSGWGRGEIKASLNLPHNKLKVYGNVQDLGNDPRTEVSTQKTKIQRSISMIFFHMLFESSMAFNFFVTDRTNISR